MLFEFTIRNVSEEEMKKVFRFFKLFFGWVSFDVGSFEEDVVVLGMVGKSGVKFSF
jgi:hypothetical protein